MLPLNSNLLNAKHSLSYGMVIGWLRCKLSFSLLRSAIMCIHGARSSLHCPVTKALVVVLIAQWSSYLGLVVMLYWLYLYSEKKATFLLRLLCICHNASFNTMKHLFGFLNLNFFTFTFIGFIVQCNTSAQ